MTLVKTLTNIKSLTRNTNFKLTLKEINEWKLIRQEKEPNIFTISNQDKIIIKTCNTVISQPSIQYIIGIHVINKLKNKIPCFARTLGRFNYKEDDKNIECIIYENLGHLNLASMLQKGLSFKKWLNFFFQIVISLEIAQDKYHFTHYDLHAKNICLQNYLHDYKIILGDSEYKIFPNGKIPIIIDFGLSSALIFDRYVGAVEYTNNSIFSFPMPGHDIFRLIISSYCHAKNSTTKKRILKLLNIFKDIDPYKIVHAQDPNAVIFQAESEFCKKIIYSPELSSYTPMMMLHELYSRYRKILLVVKKEININERLLKLTNLSSSLKLPNQNTLNDLRNTIIKLPLFYPQAKLKEKIYHKLEEITKYSSIISACLHYDSCSEDNKSIDS